MSLLAATVLLGQVAGLAPRIESSQLNVSDRTEARYRSDPNFDHAVDTTTTLTSAISVTAPRVAYSIGYGLSIAGADLTHDADRALAIMQTGRVGITYARHRLGMTLALTGTYGTQVAVYLSAPVRLDLAGTGVGTPAGTQPTGPGAPLPTWVPHTETLKTGSLGANVGFTYALTRRWTYGINANGLESGGLDFLSQRAVPPSRTVGGNMSLGYQLTREDTLTTRLGTSYIYVLQLPAYTSAPFLKKNGYDLPNTPGGWFLDTDLYESWVHNFSKRTATSLGAGISFVHADQTPGGTNDGFYAIGNASISYAQPLHDHARLTLGSTVAITSTYNPVIATIQHQGSVSLVATWTWRKWIAGVSAAGASDLPVYASYSSRVASGTATVGYAPAEPVQIQVGARINTQVLYDQYFGPAPPTDWAAFLAVILLAPPLRL